MVKEKETLQGVVSGPEKHLMDGRTLMIYLFEVYNRIFPKKRKYSGASLLNLADTLNVNLVIP